MASKTLPSNITSYDILKTLAVTLMVIDHLGSYKIIDDDWLRAIGRLCVPMWIFLIGYAQTRHIPKTLWLGAIILVIADIAVGKNIFPLNILFTFIFIRLCLDRMMSATQKSVFQAFILYGFLIFLILPTSVLFDYGTTAFIIAAYAYHVRHSDGMNQHVITGFMLFAWLSFVTSTQFDFEFEMVKAAFVAIGVFIVILSLRRFKPKEFPQLTSDLPNIAVAMIQFCGRHTLAIYVAHLILFKIIALYFGTLDDLEPFSFTLVSE